MSTELLIALCTALIAGGKLLDDFYVSDKQRGVVVTSLSAIFNWLNSLRLPDIILRLVSAFLFAGESMSPLITSIVCFAFYIVMVCFYFVATNRVAWWIDGLFFLILVPCVYAATWIAYRPAKWLLAFCLDSPHRALRALAVPISIGVPATFSFYLMRTTGDLANGFEHADQITYYVLGAIATLLFISLFPFCLLATYLLFAIIAKLTLIAVNGITLHLLKTAVARNKPFGYAGALGSVILAIVKVIQLLGERH